MDPQTNAVPLQSLPSATPRTQSSTVNAPPSAVVPSLTPVSAHNVASSASPGPQTSAANESHSRRDTFSKTCSSSHINASIAFVTLGVGAYYFYDQYMISYKSWELCIWKDCHNRPVGQRQFLTLFTSSYCQRTLSTRDSAILTTTPLTTQSPVVASRIIPV
jgi:hypothetical protein